MRGPFSSSNYFTGPAPAFNYDGAWGWGLSCYRQSAPATGLEVVMSINDNASTGFQNCIYHAQDTSNYSQTGVANSGEHVYYRARSSLNARSRFGLYQTAYNQRRVGINNSFSSSTVSLTYDWSTLNEVCIGMLRSTETVYVHDGIYIDAIWAYNGLLDITDGLLSNFVYFLSNGGHLPNWNFANGEGVELLFFVPLSMSGNLRSIAGTMEGYELTEHGTVGSYGEFTTFSEYFTGSCAPGPMGSWVHRPRSIIVPASYGEAFGTAASKSPQLILPASLSAGVGVAEALSPAAIFLESFADALGISGEQVANSTIEEAIAEAIGLATDKTASTVYAGVLDASIGVGDSKSAQAVLSAYLVEQLGVFDSPSAASVFLASLAEAVGAGEETTTNIIAQATVAEALGLGKDASASAIYGTLVDEAIGIGFDAVGLALTTRYARPISTVTPGTWYAVGAATLHDAVNEEVRSDAEDIRTETATTARFALTPLIDPGDTIHKLFMAIPAGFVPAGVLTVRLFSASIEIKEWVVGTPTADSLLELPLSSAERDTITDYTDLELEVEATP